MAWLDLRPPAIAANTEDELLWLCPHEVATLDKARQFLLYRPPDTERYYNEDLSPCSEPTCCSKIHKRVRHKQVGEPRVTLHISIELYEAEDVENLDASMKQYFTKERVRQALSHLSMPICTHVSLSDPIVSNQFNPEYIKLCNLDKSYASCSCYSTSDVKYRPQGRHFIHCNSCYDMGTATQFGFQARHSLRDGKKVLSLRLDVLKDLGNLSDRLRPDWRFHIIDSLKSKELPKAWQEWITFIEQAGKYWGKTPVESSSLSRGLANKILHSFPKPWK